MEKKKGLFDKKEDDDPFFAQHEYAEKMKSRIPGSWMMQKCDYYEAEWKLCTSFKGRFYQLYMDGQYKDCQELKDSYDDCRFVSATYNEEAAQHLVEREKKKMEERLKCHKDNDVWESRTSPPEDWNKPLPPELAKMSEDSIFQKYQENNGVLPREYGEGILSSVFITGNRSIWGAIKRSLFGDAE